MLKDDRTSSATALASEAESLLRQARAQGPVAVRETARTVCAAQPSMASIWNLAAAALDADPITLERLATRARRAPAAIARFCASMLHEDARRVLTCSRSAVVEACVRALRVPVVCAESRPGLEGRMLAQALARDGFQVTVVADAAIASEFRAGDVVLVGADAIAPDWFVNKTGTGQLCSAAQLAGVAGFVVAGLEKCIAPELAALLRIRHDDPATLWDDPPAGVRVENQLFERIALDRVAGIVTDAGLLAGGMVHEACASALPPPLVRALVDLLAQD